MAKSRVFIINLNNYSYYFSIFGLSNLEFMHNNSSANSTEIFKYNKYKEKADVYLYKHTSATVRFCILI